MMSPEVGSTTDQDDVLEGQKKERVEKLAGTDCPGFVLVPSFLDGLFAYRPGLLSDTF